MAEKSSIALESDPKVMIGSRVIDAPREERVIREYGADKGLVQTLARLAGYVAGMKT